MTFRIVQFRSEQILLVILLLCAGRSQTKILESRDRRQNSEPDVDGIRLLPVPVTPSTYSGQSTMLLLTNTADEEVIVHVEGQQLGQQKVTVPAASYRQLILRKPSLEDTQLGCGKSFYISSRLPVLVSTINLGSCSSYLNLPPALLGATYEVITWSPDPSSSGQSTVNVVAEADETYVDVSFPAGRQCDVTSGRIRFYCGDSFRIRLRPFESAFFNSSCDLSGTTIASLGGKVAVFAGNVGITVGPGNATDQTISELLPLSAWRIDNSGGVYSYVLPSIPDNDHSGYSIRVTSGGSSTSFTVSGVTYKVTAGQVQTVDFADNAAVVLRADGPLQVVQFVRGATTPLDSGAPASQIIPEVRQYASSYAYTNPPGFVHYVIVVIERNASQTGLVVDDAVVSDNRTGWRTVEGTTLVTTSFRLTRDGYSVISHRLDAAFGAFRYSYIRGNCAYAYPAGITMATEQLVSSGTTVPVPVSPWPTQNNSAVNSWPTETGSVTVTSSQSPPSSWWSVPTDGTLASTTFTPFTPGTSSNIGDDCASSNSGTKFLLAFMENRLSNVLDLSIYPVTSSDNNITVRTSGNSSEAIFQSFSLRAGERSIIRAPNETRMMGIERSGFKVTEVKSAHKVSVFGMNSVAGSCDGYLSLPVSGLGTEYYTMSYFPPDHKSQVAVVAAHNDTVVNVTLRLATRPGLYIMWNGTAYTNSRNRNVIQLNLNAMEAVQLQDNSDLTGTYVTSNHPVAVFSGNDYTQVEGRVANPFRNSHLVEQMPPVGTWGSTFYAVPFPDNDVGFIVKIVSSTSDTTVTYTNAVTSKVTSFQLSNPGDFQTVKFSPPTLVKVNCSKPVLVAQLALSGDSTSPTMMVLPPTEQFKHSYEFATGEDNSTSHFLLLAVPRYAIQRIQVDGEFVNDADWRPFFNDSEMVGGHVRVSAGAHDVTQLDRIPFGAYVYGQSVYNSAYSYPAGLCLQTSQPTSASASATPTTSVSSTSPSSTTTTATTTTPTTTITATTTVPPTTTITTLTPSSTATTPFSSSNKTIEDCTCLNITSSLQPLYNGLYYIQSDPYNDHAAYERSGACPLFLYWHQSQDFFWNIGPELGSRKGALHSASNDEPRFPYAVDRWRAYSTEIEGFADDATMTVTCLCPALSECVSIEFLNTTDGSSFFDGVFLELRTTSNGRPVYKHDELSIYFSYYHSHDNCAPYWTVSGEIGAEAEGSTLVRLESDARDPGQMTSAVTWFVFDKSSNSFQRFSELRLVCYTESNTT